VAIACCGVQYHTDAHPTPVSAGAAESGAHLVEVRGDSPETSPVAIVTGAGRNIGRAIALALADAGTDVAVVVRSRRDDGEAVAREVSSRGRRAIVGLADVRDEDAVRRIVKQTHDELGSPTVLVNNAALRRETSFADLSWDEWREVVSVILDGAYLCSRAVLPAMLDAGWGRIVNIAGLTAQTGAARRAHVVSAKAGLIGLTKALALEVAPHNITVNAVSPGRIDTVRAGEMPEHHSKRRVPVGREGRPEEVAAAVRYLVSRDAAYVTGQTLNVNGGLYL
jgi:3-oxoacyl-[acyl-carrier protein] reductase